jgi:hydroxypyruvate reductase
VNVLREHLCLIRDAALRAADPAEAVRRNLGVDGAGGLRVGSGSQAFCEAGRVRLAAVGKAAVPMAEAAAGILGKRVERGIVVTKRGHARVARLPPAVRLMEAGHPVPDEDGQAAAGAIREMAASAGGAVLVLVSGGASALVCDPAPPVRLDDVRTLTGLLLRAGADIGEINTVRKHLERLKGGQLAAAAFPAPVAALVLSDVVGDAMETIASGPTVADPTTYADARAVLERRGLFALAPAAVVERLRAGMEGRAEETPKPGDPRLARARSVIVGSNRLAAEAASAAAEELGYSAAIVTTAMQGEAREAGRRIAELVRGARDRGVPARPPACLILGGETTVTVRGTGRGGRNQELALAACLALEGVAGIALMALATDGTDGPTDAAGAIVDGGTAAAARAAGLDPAAALDNNDSYACLSAAGGLMITGPTLTNVNDLAVALVA